MCMCGWRGDITCGLVVLIIGVIFLLRNLGIITYPIWSIIWPSVLIAVGVNMIVGRLPIRRRKNQE